MTRSAFSPHLHRILPAALILMGSAAGSACVRVAAAHAQGATTASIRGSVRGAAGSTDGARVRIVNAATGYRIETAVRDQQFFVAGLEPGGPFTITVTHPGYTPATRDGVMLRLGEPLSVAFVLAPAAFVLDTLRVQARETAAANAHGGTATFVADSLLHRLPSLDRNLYDFVRLAPQVSTRIGFSGGGMSAAGEGFRFNSFLVDGMSQRTVPGGVPPEFAGLRSVPLDAVRAYQILVAPFDVRFGSFSGALVNAATRAGTNRFEFSSFVHARTDDLARPDPTLLPYERLQLGVSLAGPLRRDRLHFLVASELQHFAAPAPGAYLGQPADRLPRVPVSADDIARLDTVLRSYGMVAGTGAAVRNRNPLRNVFVRLDAALPELRSRAALSLNGAHATQRTFERTSGDAFPLTSTVLTQEPDAFASSLRLITSLGRRGGGSNELQVSRRSAASGFRGGVRQPLVRVGVAGVMGGAAELVTGTPAHAHGTSMGYSTTMLRNDLSLPVGESHVISAGLDVEWYRASRRGTSNSYGTWRFSSLDSLAAGVAESYQVTLGAQAGTDVSGGHYAAYLGDEWRIGRVVVTGGVRADLLTVDQRAPANPVVEAIFGRRTETAFRRRVLLSPRLGFTWAVTDGTRLRGGLGVFTGRPPIAWLHAPLYNHGAGLMVLRCGTLPNALGPVPAFTPDAGRPPDECGDGQRPSGGTAAVNLIGSDLRLPQTLRSVLAWERQLPGGMRATLEAVHGRGLSEYIFVNLNLAGLQGVDRHGRALYGTFSATGAPAPTVRSAFSEVVDLRNAGGVRALQLAMQLERPFASGSALTAHYTWSRVRDTQTPLRIGTDGLINWASHAVSGPHDDLQRGISMNDIPHRLVIAGTVRAPWRRWTTELSFYYSGESGSPFTYVAYGAGRRGDLNADGSNINDPVHVPRSAFDTAEIRFSGVSEAPGADNSPTAQGERVAIQQRAFDEFVGSTECLRRQRGRIVARNSCREPPAHLTVASIRQSAPIRGRQLALQLDVFNVLNLLQRDWGVQRVAVPRLLEHVGQTAPSGGQPVYRFDPAQPRWTRVPTESAYQLQLGVGYRF